MNYIPKLSFKKPSKKSSIGIYIGPESIEIVQLKNTAKGFAALKAIHKNISNQEITSDSIKKIFDSEQIKETNVTTTIPERSVMLRKFSMPIISPEDRPVAVRFEAKRHIPFNIDEVFSSFYVIKEDRSNNQMDILFAAAKKQEINSTISLLEKAGLKTKNIEPTSLAIIKALIITRNLSESSPPTAIFHFSAETEGEIIIVENEIPYLTREFSLSRKDMNIEDQLLNEIRLSFNYFKREFPEKDIAKLIVCGLKEKPIWLEHIKSSLHIVVETAFPLKDITGANLPSPQLEIPIGLSTFGLEKQKIELNLMPETSMRRQYNIKKILIGELIAAICITIAVYISQIPSVMHIKEQVEIAKTKKVIPKGQDFSSKSTTELSELKTLSQVKKNILVSYLQNTIKWNEKLKRLVKIIPKEVWITQLTIGDSVGIPGARVLILKGSAFTPEPIKELELINNFSKDLKNDSLFMAGFKRLAVGSVNKNTIDNHEVVNFDISLTTD